MDSKDQIPGTGKDQDQGHKIEAKLNRMLKARKGSKDRVWFGLGMMGLIGWSVVVPTLLGAAIGTWLERRFPGGHGWTLALLMAGLVIGCLNAWYWVANEEKAMKEKRGKENE